MWFVHILLALGVLLAPCKSNAEASSSDKCLGVVLNSEDIIQAHLNNVPRSHIYEYADTIQDKDTSNAVVAIANAVYAAPKEVEAARKAVYSLCLDMSAKEIPFQPPTSPYSVEPWFEQELDKHAVLSGLLARAKAEHASQPLFDRIVDWLGILFNPLSNVYIRAHTIDSSYAENPIDIDERFASYKYYLASLDDQRFMAEAEMLYYNLINSSSIIGENELRVAFVLERILEASLLSDDFYTLSNLEFMVDLCLSFLVSLLIVLCSVRFFIKSID